MIRECLIDPWTWFLSLVQEVGNEWRTHTSFRAWEAPMFVLGPAFVILSSPLRYSPSLFAGFVVWLSGLFMSAIAVRRVRQELRRAVIYGDYYFGLPGVPRRAIFLATTVVSSILAFICAVLFLLAHTTAPAVLSLTGTLLMMRIFLFCVRAFKKEKS